MTDALEGRVARILNSRELVINRGSSHGVKEGMVFAVLDAKLEDIKDPETGEVLGSIERPKTHVKVVSLEPGLSIARTFRVIRGRPGSFGAGLSPLAAMFAGTPDRVETLKTTEATWEDLDESESLVKTGDKVRLVPDPTA